MQLNQVKAIVSIQAMNSFIGGCLGLVLPMVMKTRGIDIITISFVFAVMPLIFQLGRMFFGILSDFWGRKLFFVLNGVLIFFTNAVYYFANTPLDYLFGKILEGTRSGSLWAVNRAFLLEKTERKWASLVSLRTVDYLFTAVGSLLSGFLVIWFFYDSAIIICVLTGFVVIPLSLFLVDQKRRKFNPIEALHFLDLRKKDEIFKIFLLLLFLAGVSYGFIGGAAGFVFPLFLANNGFNLEIIGLIMGLQMLLAGLFSYLFGGKLKMRRLVLLSSASYSAVLIPVGFSSSIYAGAFVAMYGFAEALRAITVEGLLKSLANKRSYGTDIGLLLMGFHGGDTISLSVSGILIASFGFVSTFLASVLIFSLFSATTFYALTHYKSARD